MVGRTEAFDALAAISQRKPAALPADARQLISCQARTNSIQNLPPCHDLAHPKMKQGQHMAVLGVHLDFRKIVIQRAAGWSMMRTRGANGIRTGDDFNRLVGILQQPAMDGCQILDKARTVSFTPKSLQAEQRVSPEPQWFARYGLMIERFHDARRKNSAIHG